MKKKTYHVLSFGHDKDDARGQEQRDGLLKAPLTGKTGSPSGSPTWKQRATSMPESNFQKEAHMDILRHADPVATRSYLASGSPPIVDFTKFEDRYRSPSGDYNSLLSISRGNKNDNERKATSCFSSEMKNIDQSLGTSGGGHGGGNVGAGGVNEMRPTLSGRNVLYPAHEWKPHPRLIMDALDSASEMVNIRCLNIDDLLRIHRTDQENFELREGDSGRDRKRRVGKTRSESCRVWFR
jgi:hypothetical protein